MSNQDKELIGLEITEVLIKANEGDVEAFVTLFRYIGKYAEPTDKCSQEFLDFLLIKAYLMAKHKDIKMLIQPYKRKQGRNPLHFTTVKMVYFWVSKGEKVNEAIRKVAEHTKRSEITVHDDYYKWPKSKKKQPECPPHEYVKNLPWPEQIGSDWQYSACLNNVLIGKDTPISLQEIFKAALRSEENDLLG